MLTYILSGVALLAPAWFLIPFIARKQAERTLQRRCQAERAIILTYDDGPGISLTEDLISLLRRHGVRASFFVLGRNASARPDIVRRLTSEGHEVGSHTHDHNNAWKSDPFTAARDLARGIRTVAELGADPQLFRPPYGKMTLAGLISGALRGLRYGWWTIDSRDSWARRPIEEVVSEIGAKGGGVVLMHDFDDYPGGVGPDAPAHPEHVLALTERIIEFARSQGYQMMRLRDLGDAESAPERAG